MKASLSVSKLILLYNIDYFLYILQGKNTQTFTSNNIINNNNNK